MDTKEKKDKFTIMLESDSGDEQRIGTSESSYGEAIAIASGLDPEKIMMVAESPEFKESQVLFEEIANPENKPYLNVVQYFLDRFIEQEKEYNLMQQMGFIRIVQNCKVTLKKQTKTHSKLLWVEKKYFKSGKLFSEYTQKVEEGFNHEIEELCLDEDFKNEKRRFEYFFTKFSLLPEEIEKGFLLVDIREIPPKGWKVIREAFGLKKETSKKEDNIYTLAKKIESQTSGSFNVSRDLFPILREGKVNEILLNNLSEGAKAEILTKQKEGKFINSTLDGLKKGSSSIQYLQKVLLSLAMVLSDQTKYFDKEGHSQLSGIPQGALTKYMTELPSRVSPFIILRYDSLLRQVDGKEDDYNPGGNEMREFREYITNLSEKEYLVRDGEGYRAVKLFTILENYMSKEGNVLASIIMLSSQFKNTLGSFSRLRRDTLKLLAGRQTQATMSLLLLLANYIGLSDYHKDKKELLSIVVGDRLVKKDKTRAEMQFKGAVDKMKELGIILKYSEKKNQGKLVSSFTYNPDYLKEGDEA